MKNLSLVNCHLSFVIDEIENRILIVISRSRCVWTVIVRRLNFLIDK